MERNKKPYSDLQTFVEPYTVPASSSTDEGIVDLDNPRPGPGAQLPCVAALEFLADIHEKAGGEQTKQAIEVKRNHYVVKILFVC